MDPVQLLTLAVILSAMTLGAVILLLVLIFARRQITPQDVGATISKTWVRLRLGESIGRIESQAEEIRNTYKTLERMMRSPSGRASFSELSLEILISDQLAPGCYGIREKCFPGKIPDAHIKSPDGLICIDAKFPLDNFARMNECDDPKEKQGFLKQFLKDAERHLKKVSEDYVCPAEGTAPFAFVYIPSEVVYYTLATEGYHLLSQYTFQGVQVVSPLLLGHKLELLKLGIRALQLNENAQQVLNVLQGLARRFEVIEERWRVFYSTHLRNFQKKADEIDVAYMQLRQEFLRVESGVSGKTPPKVNPTLFDAVDSQTAGSGDSAGKE